MMFSDVFDDACLLAFNYENQNKNTLFTYRFNCCLIAAVTLIKQKQTKTKKNNNNNNNN